MLSHQGLVSSQRCDFYRQWIFCLPISLNIPVQILLQGLTFDNLSARADSRLPVKWRNLIRIKVLFLFFFFFCFYTFLLREPCACRGEEIYHCIQKSVQGEDATECVCGTYRSCPFSSQPQKRRNCSPILIAVALLLEIEKKTMDFLSLYLRLI